MLPAVLAALLAVPVAAAQAQPTATLRAAATATAGVNSGTSSNSIPAGPIAAPRTATATYHSPFFGNAESALTITPQVDGVVFGLLGTLLPFAASQPNRAHAAGTVDDLLLVWPGNQAGRLTVSLFASVPTGVATSGRLAVDIGDDANFELDTTAASTTWTAPVCAAGTLRVRLAYDREWNHNFGNALVTASGHLTVRFVPEVPPVQFTPYGTACGATLTGVDRHSGLRHEVELSVANGPPGGVAAFVFGIGRTALPIPNSPCLLRTAPIVAFVLPLSAAGGAQLSLPLPGPHPRFTFHAQAVVLDPPTARLGASEGVEMLVADC